MHDPFRLMPSKPDDELKLRQYLNVNIKNADPVEKLKKIELILKLFNLPSSKGYFPDTKEEADKTRYLTEFANWLMNMPLEEINAIYERGKELGPPNCAISPYLVNDLKIRVKNGF
jgi:hypothetical protein